MPPSSWFQTEKLHLTLSIIFELLRALLSFPLLFFPKARSFCDHIAASFQQTPQRKKKNTQKAEINRVSRNVRKAYDLNEQIVLHRRPGAGHSARSPSYKSGHHRVDVASLNSILDINKLEQTATVQSGVTFQDLCHETLKQGLLPLVVPEFKSITIGGAIQGIGIESSSWQNGAVDESIIEATLILGDGSIVSSETVPDLWREVPGSNGTLALVVDAKLRLRPATLTMTVRYELLDGLESVNERINKLDEDPQWSWIGQDRLVDAVWIKDLGIVVMFAGCAGDNTDTLSSSTYVETAFSPFFFQHIEQVAEKYLSAPKSVYSETMPTEQYLFRFDRGGFWGIMALARMLPPLGYILARPSLVGCLNHFFRTSTLYKLAMLVSDLDRESIAMLQDVDVPHSKAALIVDWAIEHELDYLWLCPVKNTSSSMFSVSKGSEWVMNIGLYGVATGLPSANLDLQRLVAKCGGKVALYAHIYAELAEFWSWYDEKRYLSLRNLNHGQSFLGLWEKVGGITSAIHN